MKASLNIRKDRIFYPLLFVVWGVIIYGVNAHYSYFGAPIPGVDFAPQQSTVATVQAMVDTIAHQRNVLVSEKKPAQRGRSLEIIGTTFFRLHAITRKPAYLDSALQSCSDALRENAKSSSAYFMLGQIMSEKKEFASAKDQYEKAIACDPRSPLLQQTLGILLWFDLKQTDLAKFHLESALRLDSLFPTANYVLGVIALDKNDASAAVEHFEKELLSYSALSKSHKSTPVDQADIRMAACFSSLRLAFLYSTSFYDERKAQDRFGIYLDLETDPQRKQASANQIQKYWKTSRSR